MKYIRAISLILFTMLLVTCDEFYNCLDGDGDLVSENRSVAEFSGVNNSSPFDVRVIQDAETSIIVEADENLQQYIKTYVRGNTLIVESERDRCLDSRNRLVIEVRCPFIDRAILAGSGELQLYNFRSDYFIASLSGSGDLELNDLIVRNDIELSSSGSGDITIDGKAINGTYVLSGSGDIDADRFRVDDCTVTLGGSGSMTVDFISKLYGNLTGSGNIYYYGNDSLVNIRVSGSGRVIKR